VATRIGFTLVNTVTVGGGGELNTANDTATDDGLQPGDTGPDLAISKQHTGTFTPNGQGSYTLVVTNHGSASTTAAVTVTDLLPSGLTWSAFTSSSGWNCGTTTPANVSCTRSDALAAGASYPAIVFTVNVAGNAVSVTNTASVSGGGDFDLADNSASDPTTVTAQLVQVTVGASAQGLSFTVDNQPYTSQQTFQWAPGSTHSIGTSTPQHIGITGTYTFASWSDGGAITHDVVVPGTATAYTALFSFSLR
jgi:uncharacterized repeat protein (TIGR01451 family)